MPPDLTKEQLCDLAGFAAKGAKGKEGSKSTEDDKLAEEKFKKFTNNLVAKGSFDDLVEGIVEHLEKNPPKNVDDVFENTANAVLKIGEEARWVYDNLQSSITKLLEKAKEKGKDLKEKLSQIVHGFFFSLCTIAAIAAMVKKGFIKYTKVVARAAIDGVWKTIKEVTGFVWSVFVSVVQNSTFWACITVAGAGMTFANPVVGGFVTAVGLVGTFATS